MRRKDIIVGQSFAGKALKIGCSRVNVTKPTNGSGLNLWMTVAQLTSMLKAAAAIGRNEEQN
jgi:hypothetical protein